MLSAFIKFLQSAKAVADPQMQSVFSVFVTYIKKKCINLLHVTLNPTRGLKPSCFNHLCETRTFGADVQSPAQGPDTAFKGVLFGPQLFFFSFFCVILLHQIYFKGSFVYFPTFHQNVF